MAGYITFDQYADMGGRADAAAFPRLELKARILINSATHNRVSDDVPVRESVKMCAFELIEAIAAEEELGGIGGREVSAVSNDGVSVSYNTSEKKDAAFRKSCIIREWLGGEFTANGINLLYCGVDG